MIKKAVFIVLAGALLITSACSGENGGKFEKEVAIFETSNKDTEYQNEMIDNETTALDIITLPTLGGISLGDSPQKVIDVLGNNYSESAEPDIAGLMDEDLIIWSYESGISVYIGKTSEKVLRIISTSANTKTDLGIKVGDEYKTVYETYKPVSEEAVSRHSDEILEGWFLVEDEAVVIFDFDESDNAVVNRNVKPDSKVEKIILAYWKHLD